MKGYNFRLLRDYLGTIGITIGLAFLIRFYIIESYRIPNNAMIPALLSGDSLFVWKWPFQLKALGYTPKRGDVVVYTMISPQENSTSDSIRRIIGLPGDTVRMKEGHIALNGKSLDKSSTSETKGCWKEQISDKNPFEVCKNPTLTSSFSTQTVPQNSVLVVGDFRSEIEPKTIKSWALIPISSIKGKAWVVWLSLGSENSEEGPVSFRWERIFKKIE